MVALQVKRLFGLFPGFPRAVVGSENAAVASFFKCCCSSRGGLVDYFESGIRISIKRLSFVPRLAEHGSDTCKTIWSDSRIHERFDF